MTINWRPCCCAWHGEYAEHATKDGGVARLKKSRDQRIILVMEFDADKKPRTTVDGVPAYVEMTDAQVNELLA